MSDTLLADPPAASPNSEAKAQPAGRFSYQAIIFGIIILVTLYVGRGFLLPVFASLLLSYALIPLVRGLMKLRIPRVLASLLVVGGVASGATLGVIGLSEPALEWVEKAPQSFEQAEELLQAIKRPVDNMNAATKQLNQMTQGEEKKGEVVVRMEKANLADVILSQTPVFIGAVLSTLILLFFLLAYGDVLLRRVVEISPKLRDKIRAVETAKEIEGCVSKYLVTVTVINACLGLCIGLAFYILDFESPALWGTMAFLLNFVPYLGAFVGVALVSLASFSLSTDLQIALLYPSVYFAFTLIEGNFITPVVLGNSFTVNPIFIVLFLLFLGWMWGIPGAVMAVPILVAVKAAACRFEDTKNIATLLSR